MPGVQQLRIARETRRSQCYSMRFQITHPWEKLGADYFTFAGKDYLLVVDYYSKYPEVVCMNSKTAEATVKQMTQIFSCHGIPNVLVADNMPFNSKAFKQFARE